LSLLCNAIALKIAGQIRGSASQVKQVPKCDALDKRRHAQCSHFSAASKSFHIQHKRPD